MSGTLRATAALIVVTLVWGATFVWMKDATGAVRSVWGQGHDLKGIALFLALRFLLAAVVLAAAFPPCRRHLRHREVWTGGSILGGVLLLGFVLQMGGLLELHPATSAFLTSLYVTFTAILVVAIERRPLNAWITAGVVLATTGAAFINGTPDLNFTLAAWLTLGCALAFALHILATDRITRRLPAPPLTLVSFLVVGAGALALLPAAAWVEGPVPAAALAELAFAPGFIEPLLCSSLLATVLALSLMNRYQRELSPVRAAIIYAIEPVWAALYAVALDQPVERPAWFLFGAGALLAGNLVAEIMPRLRRPVPAR